MNPNEARQAAIYRVARVLTNPLLLTSVPEREDAYAIAKAFQITAIDLLDCALKRARNT